MNKKNLKKICVGVLALQGDFLEHAIALKRLGVTVREVRLPGDLDLIDGLIIPGGESTVMARLLDSFSLKTPLIKKIQEGMPVWGTCAGLILLAAHLKESDFSPLGLLNITVARNAFGRQVDSFEALLVVPSLGKERLQVFFIRAPIITKVGEGVRVLATLDGKTTVAVESGNIFGTTFHPELGSDLRFHAYFVERVKSRVAASKRVA